MTPLKTNELRATFDGVSMGLRPTQLDENRASRQVYHVPDVEWWRSPALWMS